MERVKMYGDRNCEILECSRQNGTWTLELWNPSIGNNSWMSIRRYQRHSKRSKESTSENGECWATAPSSQLLSWPWRNQHGSITCHLSGGQTKQIRVTCHSIHFCFRPFLMYPNLEWDTNSRRWLWLSLCQELRSLAFTRSLKLGIVHGISKWTLQDADGSRSSREVCGIVVVSWDPMRMEGLEPLQSVIGWTLLHHLQLIFEESQAFFKPGCLWKTQCFPMSWAISFCHALLVGVPSLYQRVIQAVKPTSKGPNLPLFLTGHWKVRTWNMNALSGILIVMYCGMDWFCWVSPHKSSRLSRGSRWLSKTSVMRSLRWEQCWGPTCWVCFQETLQELFNDDDFLTCDHPLKPQTLWNFQLTPENSMGWKMNLANSKLTEYGSVAGTLVPQCQAKSEISPLSCCLYGFQGSSDIFVWSFHLSA